MKTLPRVDVVIVGGGWSGLLMAKELGARTSLSVLVLERGVPRDTSTYAQGMDELDYAIRLRMMQDASKETVTVRHSPKDRALPIRQFASFLPGDGTGGAGEHWNGLTPRFAPDCFDIRTRTVERYGLRRLPANSSIQDWAMTYDELEPYYTKAEQLLGVSGDSAGDPFAPPRSAPFPTPPMKTATYPALFGKAARSLGYHPYPAASSNLSRIYKNPDGIVRPPCQYCGYCERFGCMVGAKAQPTNTLLPVIARQKGVTLRHGAKVRRVRHSNGQATGVTYVNGAGEEVLQPAGLVILASWTLNNTRLLLLSKVGVAYDPSTGKGVVGRNFTHQVTVRLNLFFRQPLNGFMGAGAAGVAISDLDCDNFDHKELTFIRGGGISATALGARPIANFGAVPLSLKRDWGSEWKKAAVEYFDRTARLTCSAEHMAYRSNYLDLDPTYTDSSGDPLLRLTIDWYENEHNTSEFFAAKMTEIGRAMDATTTAATPPLRQYSVNHYQSTHLQGGAIAGASPESSVVNKYLQHWQTPNLFVLGASSFPQNASGNPTLTLLAQTLMTADALVGRYMKHPGALA
ncbi:MAG: GMC family oxidoreductase [Bryobacteraceae bacterium]